MLIVDLPGEVVVHLLLDWLDVENCRALDTSLCSHAQRAILLQIFANKTFVWDFTKIGIFSNKNILYWIWRRNIQIEAMIIPSMGGSCVLDMELLTSYLKKKGTGVSYLSLVRYDEQAYGFFEKIPKYINSSELTSILSCCPNLTTLDELCSESVSLVSMGSLRRNCKSLCKLSIQHHKSDSWDPTPLIALVAGGDCGLKQLRLPAAERYMSKFATILKNLPHLESLHFSRSRDISLSEPCDKAYIAIAEHCKDIQSLYFSNLRNVSDSSLFALSHGCANLQHLHVDRCKYITAAGIVCIVRKCHNLTILSLNECPVAVTDEAVVAIAANCPNLYEFKFSRAVLITDASLVALGQHCANLGVIDFSYCVLVTSIGVSALAEGRARLTNIDMNSCFAADNVCIEAIARHCASLRYAGLMNNGWLTEGAVQNLVDNCPHLCQEGLALNGCMQLSQEFRHSLQDRGLYRYA